MATPEDKQTDRERELADFWDIASLLPPRPRRDARPTRNETPSGVEIQLPEPVARRGGEPDAPRVQDAPLSPRPTGTDAAADQLGRAHYVPPHTPEEQQTAETPELSYAPANSLIHRVEVYAWNSDYRYFDRFIRDAEDFAARPAPQERPNKAPFFSFFPQYAQMNRAHTAWYLWWREQVREGQYPDTDYAYILLYLFELINLPVQEDAAGETARQMARVWMAYRKRAPKLDHYMCEWLCDYCLIHRQPVPGDLLAPALEDILQLSRMKEFYLSATVTGGEQDTAGARNLLTHCCQYDYHKSKFAGGEHAALFDRIIPGAVAHAMPLLLGQEGQPPLITLQDSIVTRDAYTGALCAYQNKRRITVAYTSFSRSHDLRFLVGDMVKHIENRLRKYIGVRSRLSVMSLPTAVRDALDAYLDPLLPEATATPSPKKQAPRPAWESLYDLPAKTVSAEEAARIEAASWETTRILTEAFGGTDEQDEAPSAAPEPVPEAPPETGESVELAPELVEFLRLALADDTAGQRELAGRLHTLPDALADRLNEWAVEGELGDVILEDTGAGYAVIEDYRDHLMSLPFPQCRSEGSPRNK